LQVAVCGGDDAHVYISYARNPDFLDLALLDEAEQLHLQFQRHFADFVQEQRAAICQLNFASFICKRAGEGALDMSKQLGLQEVLRNGTIVDCDERLALPAAVEMD
jgi:hypothetical protein